MVQLGRSTAAKKTILALLKFCSCVVVMATLAFAGDAAISHERSEQVTEHLAAGEFGPAFQGFAARPCTNAQKLKLVQHVGPHRNGLFRIGLRPQGPLDGLQPPGFIRHESDGPGW